MRPQAPKTPPPPHLLADRGKRPPTEGGESLPPTNTMPHDSQLQAEPTSSLTGVGRFAIQLRNPPEAQQGAAEFQDIAAAVASLQQLPPDVQADLLHQAQLMWTTGSPSTLFSDDEFALVQNALWYCSNCGETFARLRNGYDSSIVGHYRMDDPTIECETCGKALCSHCTMDAEQVCNCCDVISSRLQYTSFLY